MKAFVLAGGFPQIELIKQLKHRGYFVILADYNSDPVAKPYADIFYQVSTLDEEAIEQIAVKEQVKFLITVCTDQALLTVAKVSEHLGLPCYIDYDMALNVTNKSCMKKIFTQYGIPTARYVVTEKLEEASVSAMHYPLIVKPADCNSSKGVKKIENEKEWKEAFLDAVQLSRTNTVIIEEFIDGMELSVDVYVENGKANILCVSNSNKIKEKDKFIIFRALYPVVVDTAVLEQIKDIVQKIADAFKIKSSPMLVQMLFDGKKIAVIEFSARTGGGLKYLLIQHASGFDVIGAVIDLTVGKKPEFKITETQEIYLLNDFVYCSPGIFDHVEGFEEAKNRELIKDYYIFKWKGAVCGEINASGDRICGYTIIGKSQEEVVYKHKEVRNMIKVISSEGRDIMRHDLLTDLKIKNGFLYST